MLYAARLSECGALDSSSVSRFAEPSPCEGTACRRHAVKVQLQVVQVKDQAMSAEKSARIRIQFHFHFHFLARTLHIFCQSVRRELVSYLTQSVSQLGCSLSFATTQRSSRLCRLG